MRRFLKIAGLIFVLTCLVPVGFWFAAQIRENQPASALKPENGQFVGTAEGRIHVSIWGPPGGRPVLMTHGMAAWGGLWADTAQHLAGRGYRVIAMDLAPFGLSDRSNGDFSRSRQAKRLNLLAAALDLESYILVGHSYGGGVALEAALTNEERMAGMVLVCPVVKLIDGSFDPASEKVPALLGIPVVTDMLIASTIGNPLLTGTLARRFMHRKEGLTGRDVAILQWPMPRTGNGKAMGAWLRQFLAEGSAPLSRHREAVARLDLPVTLIWGEEDAVTPISLGEELASIMTPQAFHRLKNTGHMPQLEDRETFSRLLGDTLDAMNEKGSVIGSQLRGTIPIKLASDS